MVPTRAGSWKNFSEKNRIWIIHEVDSILGSVLKVNTQYLKGDHQIDNQRDKVGLIEQLKNLQKRKTVDKMV